MKLTLFLLAWCAVAILFDIGWYLFHKATERHSIDTECYHCSCGATMCLHCGDCSDQCDCK